MRKISIAFVLLFLYYTAISQDIHYAHIHAAPTYINPAMTGVFNGGNIRLIANARSQWQGITNGYNTLYGSADMKMGSVGGSILGMGLQVHSDRAGDLNLSTNSVNLNTSVMLPLDNKRHAISMGISNGFTNRSIDWSKLKGNDDEPTNLGFRNNTMYWDVSAGGAYFYTVDEFNYFFGGFSMSHINKPVASLIEDGRSTISPRMSINMGGSYAFNKVFALQPSVVYFSQGAHAQLLAGSFLKFSKTNFTRGNRIDRSQNAFYAGLWVRAAQGIQTGADAIIAAFRADLGPTTITLSFDVNVSGLAAVTPGTGAPEFSVVHIINNRALNRRLSKVVCPSL